jgi:hypothetical protein
MPKQKKTKVTVTALEHAIRKNEACIVLEMKLGAEDKEPTAKHGRDLDRALHSFQLYTDAMTENGANEVFKTASVMGPYVIGDEAGLMAMVVLARAEGATEELFSARVRTGVNGISSLLKAAGYGVKVRIKPVEQIVIPATDGAPAAPSAAPSSETITA